MSDEEVLVTGGSGYIASYTIKLLQEEGYKVRTSIRDTTNETKKKHLNDLCPEARHKIEVVEADLLNPDAWLSAVNGCKYVLHIASPFPMMNPRSDDEIITPAVEGTLNVLKACANTKTVKRVVVTSSVAAVYGPGSSPTSGEAYSEADWLDPEIPSLGTYMRSKALAEKAAWKFVEDLPGDDKFELAVVNPSLVVGPVTNSTPGSSVSVLTRFLNREFPMVPQLCFGTCDVRDVALAHLRCMTLPQAAGFRHIINSDMVWMKQMADILAEEFNPQGYKVPTRVLPNAILSVSCWFSKELRQGRKFGTERKIDTRRMSQELGITPTPVAKSLIDMAYSMIEKGFIRKTAQYRGPNGARLS